MLHRAAPSSGPIRGPASGRMLGALAGAWARRLFAAFAVVIYTASSAFSEDNISSRPDYCKPLATIQWQACALENHFRCGNGDLDYVWIEGFDSTGSIGVEVRTPMLMALHQGGAEKGWGFDLEPPANFVADWNDLNAGSAEDFTQAGVFSLFGVSKPATWTGSMRLLRKGVMLKGRRLDEYRLDGIVQLPKPMPAVKGWANILRDPVHDLAFIAGSANNFGGTMREQKNELADILFQGDEGFMSTIPAYGCPETSTLEAQTEESHG